MSIAQVFYIMTVTPRDDRFYTPRAQASTGRSMVSIESTVSDFETPRTSRSNSYRSVASSSDNSHNTSHSYHYQQLQQSLYTKQQSKSIFSGIASTGTHHPLPPRHDFHQSRIKPADSVNVPFPGRKLPSNYQPYFEMDTEEDIFSLTRHSRYEQVHRLIVEQKVPIDIRDANGNTILSIASQNGNKRIVKLALRYGCDINATNVSIQFHSLFEKSDGNSPVPLLITMSSLNFRRTEVIQLFISVLDMDLEIH